jgi:uncharacterized protein (TIGR00730 family)
MTVSYNLCVYCGSGPGKQPAYMAAARTLGKSLADNGIGLVYGGGSMGLMGETARAVLENGGRVTGIIPEFLTQKERMLTDVQELIVTATMHERKLTMFEKSDGFIVLPGGLGTLEELSEVSTWAQLDRHNKPIIICNIDGYWEPLLTLFSHMREEHFIRPGLDFKFEVVKDANEAVPAFLNRIANVRQTVPVKPVRQTM